MTDMARTLYPLWSGPRVALPEWVIRHGLVKYRPIVQRVYASADHWQQAEADGLGNIAPVLVRFNKSPSELRREVGGEAWKTIHHASLKSNVDRLVLTMIGGWSFEEAMIFPAKERKAAKSYLDLGKSVLMLACRLSRDTGDLKNQIIIARDVQRLGGQLDQSWGRKRLKREHDALVLKNIVGQSNPTPWADAWFCDVGPFSFSLLKSETELAIEGGTQRHCAGSYAKDCRAGKEVVLRVEGPERATCSWSVGDFGIQVKGFANGKVSDACVKAAKEARLAYQSRNKRAKP